MKLTAFKIGFIATLSVLLLTLGVLLQIVFPEFVRIKLNQELTLRNDSQVYRNWEKIPFPVIIKLYFFNVTNPQEIIDNTNKPILQEMGPYTFRQHRTKVDIKFNPEEDTVSYKELSRYEYLPEESNGTLSDNITILNFPFALATGKADEMGLMAKILMPQLVRTYKATLFITKTADELLFKGYHDKMLNHLQKLSGEELFPKGNFGFFVGKNNTVGGDTHTVFSGIKNPKKFGQVYKFNNSTSLKWWYGDYCNEIKGSDGMNHKKFLTRQDTIYAFSAESCRSAHFSYQKDINVHGIKGYRFVIADSFMDSPQVEPKHECLCKNGKYCYKTGAYNLGACLKETPTVFSYPHFYAADKSYTDSIIGLNKDRKYESYLDVEPTSGFTMRGYRRGQINVALKPLSYIKELSNINETIFPVLWIDEGAVWPEELAATYWNTLILPQLLARYLTIGLLLSGGVAFFSLLLITLISKIPKRYSQKNLAIRIKMLANDELYEKASCL